MVATRIDVMGVGENKLARQGYQLSATVHSGEVCCKTALWRKN